MGRDKADRQHKLMIATAIADNASLMSVDRQFPKYAALMDQLL